MGRRFWFSNLHLRYILENSHSSPQGNCNYPTINSKMRKFSRPIRGNVCASIHLSSMVLWWIHRIYWAWFSAPSLKQRSGVGEHYFFWRARPLPEREYAAPGDDAEWLVAIVDRLLCLIFKLVHFRFPFMDSVGELVNLLNTSLSSVILCPTSTCRSRPSWENFFGCSCRIILVVNTLLTSWRCVVAMSSY